MGGDGELSRQQCDHQSEQWVAWRKEGGRDGGLTVSEMRVDGDVGSEAVVVRWGRRAGGLGVLSAGGKGGRAK